MFPLLLLLLACGGGQAPDPAQPVVHDSQPDQHSQHKHHGPEGMPHRFEDADAWAKRFEDPARDAWQKPAEVVKLMQIAAGMQVADIGAGTGYFLPLLSAAAGAEGKVAGLDIEKDMVRYMLERAEREGLKNVTARVVAMDDAGFAPGSTDRILIVDTWHHISDRVAYSKKLAAALTEGGTIMVVDFTMESEHGPPKAHRLEASAVVAELEAAGLQASVLEETLPNQYIVVAKSP
jgi:cyclopropane fatty-acyl-phospholipid synthase-like methyltransferase